MLKGWVGHRSRPILTVKEWICSSEHETCLHPAHAEFSTSSYHLRYLCSLSTHNLTFIKDKVLTCPVCPYCIAKTVINLFLCPSLSLEHTCSHKVDQSPAHYSQELTSLSPCTGCLSWKFTYLALSCNLLAVPLLSDHCYPRLHEGTWRICPPSSPFPILKCSLPCFSGH